MDPFIVVSLSAAVANLMDKRVRAALADWLAKYRSTEELADLELIGDVPTFEQREAAETLALELARHDPDLAVRWLVLLQEAEDRIRGEEPVAEGSVPSDVILDLPDPWNLRVSAGIRVVYERVLSEGFPWAGSDELEMAAEWCALRDAVGHSDEDEDAALREDADFLNDWLGRPPADVPQLESR